MENLRIEATEIAKALAVFPAPDGKLHLVRWDHTYVTLGLRLSEGMPRKDVYPIALRLIQSFADVGRKLDICLRSGQGEGVQTESDQALAPCKSDATEIDLVIDTSTDPSLASYVPSSRTVGGVVSDLESFWEKARLRVASQPAEYFCQSYFSSDPAAQRLVGIEGLIRVPVTMKDFARNLKQCETGMTYALLGSAPIRGSDETKVTFSKDLVQLLYSSEFQSGETYEDVLKALRAVAPVD